MVATYVSSRLSYSDVQIPTDQVGCRLTTCAVSIPTHRGKRTNLVNVYYPNGSNSEADVEWLYSLETNQNSWVVAGDFNTKDSGDHLANTILNSRLVVLNDGSFTRIGQRGQRSSAIDLTLTSPDLSLDAEWTIGTDHLQSEHLVLHKADPTPAEIDTSPKFLYHKADWELLALKLTSECENHDPRDPDINTHYENIRSMILRAAEATIPKYSLAPTVRTNIPQRGGTKSVPNLPEPKDGPFANSRKTCLRATKWHSSKPPNTAKQPLKTPGRTTGNASAKRK
ncbi:hypothetical protein ACOMHN_059599 [Nucella lapillus]